MIFDPIMVLTRPKKNGIGTHWGVHFPDGRVYDYAPGVDLRVTTYEGFAEAAQVACVREIPWNMAHIVRARLEELKRNPRRYDALNWNCETFAEWLTSGVPKSTQAIVALLLAGLVVFLAIASRAK